MCPAEDQDCTEPVPQTVLRRASKPASRIGESTFSGASPLSAKPATATRTRLSSTCARAWRRLTYGPHDARCTTPARHSVHLENQHCRLRRVDCSFITARPDSSRLRSARRPRLGKCTRLMRRRDAASPFGARSIHPAYSLSGTPSAPHSLTAHSRSSSPPATDELRWGARLRTTRNEVAAATAARASTDMHEQTRIAC